MKDFKQILKEVNEQPIEESTAKDLAKATIAGLAIGSGIFTGAKMLGAGSQEPQTQEVQAAQPTYSAPSFVPNPQVTQPKQKAATPTKVYHHDAIKTMVKEDEGYRLTPYNDTRNILTVGIGHNLEAQNSRNSFVKAFGEDGARLHTHALRGGSLTKDQVDKLFDADYEEHLNRTINLIPNLHQHPPQVQAVLVSGTYRGHVGDAPTFRKLFNSGKYTEAATEMLNRKEYKNPSRDKHGNILAPGVLKRLERDSKVIRDYANSRK